MLALALSLAVAVIYMAVLRVLDLNEREPLWALLLMMLLGFTGAGILRLAASPALVELTVLPGAVAEEATKFAAVLLGVIGLTVAGRMRGWSELNGIMDGIVYGAAVGFGFAAGEMFLRDLANAGSDLFPTPFMTMLWTNALSGLVHGVFGALIGMGVAAGMHATTPALRTLWPVAGFGLGVAANLAHRVLAYGDALGGTSALYRTWAALLLPLLLVIAVAVRALGWEQRAILEQLQDEGGAVTPEDVALLRSHARRQGLYWGFVLRGDLTRAATLRSLHIRQVQLALAKRRAGQARQERQRERLLRETASLRAAVLDHRRRLEALSASH
jgi:RsiW-degrading membrane proteinase PrsW (M82 family)